MEMGASNRKTACMIMGVTVGAVGREIFARSFFFCLFFFFFFLFSNIFCSLNYVLFLQQNSRPTTTLTDFTTCASLVLTDLVFVHIALRLWLALPNRTSVGWGVVSVRLEFGCFMRLFLNSSFALCATKRLLLLASHHYRYRSLVLLFILLL